MQLTLPLGGRSACSPGFRLLIPKRSRGFLSSGQMPKQRGQVFCLRLQIFIKLHLQSQQVGRLLYFLGLPEAIKIAVTDKRPLPYRRSTGYKLVQPAPGMQ